MSNSTDNHGAVWNVLTLQELLTAERLRSYLRAVDGDIPRALQLYEWNIEASAAVTATTGMVEIIVRNALDQNLTSWAAQRQSSSWFDIVPLDRRGTDDVAKARDRATLGGRVPELHGKVVAELSFGFWRYLTAQRYHAALWVPALHKAFPHGDSDIRKRRTEVERHLANLMLVRNRAAHHEPIHRRNLIADLRAAVKLATWIHPDAGAWVADRSRLDAVMRDRPES